MLLSQLLKDWVLILAVVILVSIDVLFLLIYTAVEVVRGTFYPILLSNEENIRSLVGVSDMHHISNCMVLYTGF